MTESVQSAAPAAQPSFWEDLIEIFYAPVGVFRRWQNRSMWPPTLFIVITVAIVSYFTFNTLQPAFEAEFDRAAARQISKSSAGAAPTAEQAEKARSVVVAVGRYFVGVGTLIAILVIGIIVWLLGKLFGAEQTFNAAMVVAAWSYMPRVLGTVLGGVQGLLMDPGQLNSIMAISVGPARFFDPDTTNPLLYQLLGRFDLMTIWVTVLLAIGLYVTGKVSKERAAVFGLVIWLVGGLQAFQAAYVAM